MERIDVPARARRMTDNASSRRLPIEIVVKRSFLYVWESREVLGAPFIIYSAIAALVEFLSDIAAGGKNSGAIYILAAADQIFAVAFAVGIHRFILQGEVRPGFQFYRWDRHFVQYVLITLLLLVMAMAAALMVIGFVGADAAEGNSVPGIISALAGIALMAGVAVMLSRLALALPSAALGDGKRPRDIWQATTGNGLRLLGAALLTALPFLIIEAALSKLAPITGGSAIEFVIIVAEAVVSTTRLIVVTAMLSLSYDVLIRGGGPTLN
jgi:hypothetical protein